MGKALIGVVQAGGRTLASAAFSPIANGAFGAPTTPEAEYQVVCRVAGTFSKFALNMNATGTSRTYRFRVNGANGNQVINPTNTTAGVYSDNSNTDTLAAGDKWDFSTSSTGTPSAFWGRTVFEATSNHAGFYSSTHASHSTDSTTVYGGLGGSGGTLQTTESNVQAKVRVGGTLRYLQLFLSSNARATSTTYKTRINGADGNCSITVTAGASGLFEDTSNTDTVASGDLINISVTTSTGGGAIAPRFLGAWTINTTDAKNDLFGSTNTGATRTASGTADYYPFISGITSSTTEANASIQHGFDGQATRLRLYVSANTYSTDATATFRVAAADGNQTVTLTAGATGWFEDTTHTDSFTANQDCCVKIVGGTSGSITIRTIGLTESSQTAYNQSAQGSTSPTAPLSRQTGKPLRATSTATASATALRVVLWSIQATATVATSIVRSAGKLANATASMVQSIAHAIAASRTASTAPGSTATKSTAHATSGQASPTAARSSATGKGAQATTAPTGLLARANAVIRRVSATVSATIAKAGGKPVQATTTPAKSLVRLTGSVRQATTTPTGRFTAALTKALQAVASVIATNPISYALTLRVSASLTASLTKLRVFIGRSAEQVINAVGQSASAVISGWIGKTSSSSTTFTGKSADE